MTKSDNFFDITGAATPPATLDGDSPSAVDFDVFGSEAPAELATDASDLMQTALLPNSPRPAPAMDLEFDQDDDPPSPVIVTAPTPSVVPIADPVAAPAAGSRLRWIAIAVAVVLAVAAWWLVR